MKKKDDNVVSFMDIIDASKEKGLIPKSHTIPQSVLDKKTILDEKTILETHLVLCNELIIIAKEEYEENPGQGRAYALTNLISTSQSLLKDLSFLKNNDDKVIELVDLVFQPFLKTTIKILGDEILNIWERNRDPELKKLFNKLSLNFGDALANEYNTALTKIGVIFDCSVSSNTQNNEENSLEDVI